MRYSIRWKFYLLVLPTVVIVIGLMAVLMFPYLQVQDMVGQVKQGLDEVIPAESFNRNYQRQLRECAAFIATGSNAHQRLYEDAARSARIDLRNWITAEKLHTGDEPVEHKEELEVLNKIEKAYEEINRSCELAISLAQSGQRASAITNLEQSADGPEGRVVTDTLNEQLPDEEAQLDRYLDYLTGAAKSVLILRLLGLKSNTESMKVHIANATFAEHFASYYNLQIRQFWAYAVNGLAEDERQSLEARAAATEYLQKWKESVGRLMKPADRRRSLAAIGKIESGYNSVNKAQDKAAQAVKSGDAAGALALLESKAGPSLLSTLTTAISKDVEAQKALLLEDAETIASRCRNAYWGVVIFIALLLLVVIGAAVLASRNMVRPIVKLQEATQRFGEGDVNARVDIKSRDEIGLLAQTFNEMADTHVKAEDQLRRARDQLEVRVDERTRELADANEELRQQIEERQRAERELERLNEDLRRINVELEGYAHTVSHDLKGPLTALMLASTTLQDLMREGDLYSRRQEIEDVLEIINNNVWKSSDLTDGLLVLAEAGQRPKDVERVDVSEVVERIRHENSSEMEQRAAELVAVEPLGGVIASPTHIYQLFANLIRNCIKHCVSDHPVITVKHLGDDPDGSHRYLVRDNGKGIPPELLDKIFEPFFKGETGGAGIGLATVSRIVDVYGGKVRAYNDNGACFEFNLKDFRS
jgi:signal transduction histidine kinase